MIYQFGYTPSYDLIVVESHLVHPIKVVLALNSVSKDFEHSVGIETCFIHQINEE